jgi:hypothetical protein
LLRSSFASEAGAWVAASDVHAALFATLGCKAALERTFPALLAAAGAALGWRIEPDVRVPKKRPGSGSTKKKVQQKVYTGLRCLVPAHISRHMLPPPLWVDSCSGTEEAVNRGEAGGDAESHAEGGARDGDAGDGLAAGATEGLPPRQSPLEQERAAVNLLARELRWAVRAETSSIPNAGDGLFATRAIPKRSFICEFKGTVLHSADQLDVINTVSLVPNGRPMATPAPDRRCLTKEETVRVLQSLPGVTQLGPGAGTAAGAVVVENHLNCVLDPTGVVNPAQKANDCAFNGSRRMHRGTYMKRDTELNNAEIVLCVKSRALSAPALDAGAGAGAGGFSYFVPQLWSMGREIKAGEEIFIGYGPDYWFGEA